MRRPDFFIVGAPKCGTTALYSYLDAHPGLFMGKKELHHFGRDLRTSTYSGERADPAWYLSHFQAADPQQVVGEASVWYLSSKRAAQEIKTFNPEARIVIMLRNPVDMLYSLYNMFIWVKDLTPGGVIDAETKERLTFEQAVETQDARKAAFLQMVADEAEFGDRELRLFHTEAALYSEQVSRYLSVFPSEQVKVILFDEFIQETARVYAETLQFLGVEDQFRPDFEVVNANREVRNTRLHWVLRSREAFGGIRRAGRFLFPERVRRQAYLALMRYNVKHEPRVPMAVETRAFLEEIYSPDLTKLGRLLDLDLEKKWMKRETV